MMKGVLWLLWRCARGYVFTLEACAALVLFASLIPLLGALEPMDVDKAVLYKQAGDYAQMTMVKGCENNETCRAELLLMLGRKAEGDECATAWRTLTNNGSYTRIPFTLCV